MMNEKQEKVGAESADPKRWSDHLDQDLSSEKKEERPSNAASGVGRVAPEGKRPLPVYSKKGGFR